MGTKRFMGLETVNVNVAGAALRAMDIEPMQGLLNIEPYKGQANIHISCDGQISAPVPITLGRQDSLPMNTPLTDTPQHLALPTCATTCLCFAAAQKPSARIYMESPYDRVDFSLAVVARQGEGIYTAMVDFPKAFALLLNIGFLLEEFYGATLIIKLGSQVIIERSYTFVGTEGTTLCWINDYGTTDCYTFTTPTAYRNNAMRTTAATTSRRAITVATPLLPYRQLQWLSQIESSPKVWLRQGGSWHQVEIEKFSAEIKPDLCSSAQLSIFIDNPTIRRI